MTVPASSHSSPSPVLSADTLRAITREALHASRAGTMSVRVNHVATGISRISNDHVRLTNSGDTLNIAVWTRFGGRSAAEIAINQLDVSSIRAAVRHAESLAHELYGDAQPTFADLPVDPPAVPTGTVWHDSTVDAMTEARQTIVPTLLQPIHDAGLAATAYVGTYARSQAYADKQGYFSIGQETDAELTAIGWTKTNESLGAPGWAGQAARDWKRMNASRVGADAARLSRLAMNPVGFEPGRRVAILGRPAVAQILRAIAPDYGEPATNMGMTPLSSIPLGRKVVDERVNLTSDPFDPDGGYLPFDDDGFPMSTTRFLEHGHLANLAWTPLTAATNGRPGCFGTKSLRLEAANGPLLTVEEMIAGAKEAIYVNRLSGIQVLHWRSGIMTGTTNGGCFLVRNGKIDKAVKDFRFIDSFYFFMNRLIAMGTSERAPFGYSPWHGDWPIAPTIVPPIMVSDFNFVALADAV